MGNGLLSILSEFTGVIVFVALLAIFLRTHSPWILAALIAEGVTLAMRVAFKFVYQFEGLRDAFIGAWQLAALVMAVCLLGYAVNLPPWRRSGQ
jgi:hypothetical protein